LVVCAVTMFYTHRATHGRTAPERATYAIGEKAGEEAPADAKLPSDADLNMMAQKYFKQQGSGTSRVGTWPLRKDTPTDSNRRISGSEPINEILSARQLERWICIRSVDKPLSSRQ
jgi:hypothetical protein